ncbi:16S rRNA (guanine(527)-N(7))-methyltransferase RsmG [Thalassovita sp.]|uniref:16S rRNA (guanine(527)-N(7))-methyltransferase RsmG n=1 Tax=Thalassovita sp. TaxID=1979401 RepID=UPI0029DE8F35|nr:16S rRNA (guanine(527)-N(7))-methyltransferase RsmG [Thalassovita sp.]
MSDLLKNVSRETAERLKAYADLLQKWNPRINLVARSTLPDLWERHFLDSAQVFSLAPEAFDSWVDLGSGGGFPGLVCAILAQEQNPVSKFTLVESDARKSVFLRTVIRETGLSAIVLSDRIEALSPLQADVLSARALADLATLLSFSERHLGKAGVALFPKGVNWQKECQVARTSWKFECETFNSATEPGAVILRIGGISRV